MKTEIMKDKTGVEMLDKEGVVMTKNHLELGDEFVPIRNKVFERTNEAEVKGKKTSITNYSILANVRNAETKQPVTVGDKHDLFIELTNGQAKSLLNRKEEGIDITQHLWNTYNYENKYGTQLGVGIKGRFNKPKTFEELDQESEAIQEEQVEN